MLLLGFFVFFVVVILISNYLMVLILGIPVAQRSGKCITTYKDMIKRNEDQLPIDVMIKLREYTTLLSFQPVLHDWFNRGRGMCCPVSGMVLLRQYIKINNFSGDDQNDYI